MEARINSWWDYGPDDPTRVQSMSIDDVQFVQPVGFVWFYKPRYRIPYRSEASAELGFPRKRVVDDK